MRQIRGKRGFETETGMMPRAADRPVQDKPFAKRGAIMRAGGAYREQVIAASDKKDRFATYVPEQHGSVRDLGEFNSLGEVGSAQFRLFFAHSILAEADAVSATPNKGSELDRLGRSCAPAAHLTRRPT